MQQTRRVGLQSATAGFMIIAFAVAVLLSWAVGPWWIFFPVLMIEIGGFYAALGLVAKRAEGPARRGPASSSYYIFWGPTLVILGAMWILGVEADVPGMLLFVVFLLWVGAVAIILSIRRRGTAQS